MTIYTPITHEQFVADVMALAAHFGRDAAWLPSFIIGIGRGGLAPAVYLSHATGLPMLSVDFSSQDHDLADAPLTRLAERSRNGERLLFLDDINDTGRTIATLRTSLRNKGAVPGSVRFATLIDNITSTQKVEFSARSIDRTVTKDWFIFPWEAVAPVAAIAEDAAEVPERTT